MLLKINDKRESSIKFLEKVYRTQGFPSFKKINGIINVDDNRLNGVIYVVDGIYHDRIENQYLLEINDENIERLTKEYNLYFVVNDHSYEETSMNASELYPVNYFTIDIVDIKPKTFVDVDIKRFGQRAEELTKVDTITIPNEILDVCNLLSEKYDKINITLNSENTIAELSVIRNDDKEAGIKFIPKGLYSKTEEDVQFILFNRSINSDRYEFFPVYVDNLLPDCILNLKRIEDRIYDLCSRIKYNNDK